MKLYYDFHIHTGLSPCGDESMTPNNIVNMAMLKELDCIAVTDHNTVGNAGAVMAVARATENAPLVLPGMEVETAEEAHVICLFPTLPSAEAFAAVVRANLPPVKNRQAIFGNQSLFDTEDNIIGEEEQLLLTATAMDIHTVISQVKALGGVAYPAHIDRPSYSILASLGFLPDDLDIHLVEISKAHDPEVYLLQNKRLIRRDCAFIQSSDAHYLENISERERYLRVPGERTAENIIRALRELAYRR